MTAESAAFQQGPRPVQTSLQFGPVDHFDAVHGSHNANVAVCTLDHNAKQKWVQRVLSHDGARAVLPDLCSYTDINVYQGQNGFHLKSVTRSIQDVQVLTSCWVDVDYYNVPELSGLDASDVTNRILQEHDWLPEPSMVISSGRGAYLVWLFDDRVHTSVKQITRWSFAMRMLTDLLRPYGADPQAIDAARVLRVIGSTNTKNGELVALESNYVGRRINFGKFTSLVLDHTQEMPSRRVVNFPPRARNTDPQKQLKRGTSPKADYRAFLLHSGRLEDYVRLVRLRGGKLTDHRKRMAYWVACSLAWTCDSLDVAKREMEAFIQTHFQDAHRYQVQAVENVLLLMTQTNVVKLWKGEQTSWRHKARTQTIIGRLEITADEQAGLTELVSRDQMRQRQKDADRTRKESKRRQQGMVPQDEYTGRVAAGASQRVAEARSLRGQGFGMGEIAARLGVTVRSVRGYLT